MSCLYKFGASSRFPINFVTVGLYIFPFLGLLTIMFIASWFPFKAAYITSDVKFPLSVYAWPDILKKILIYDNHSFYFFGYFFLTRRNLIIKSLIAYIRTAIAIYLTSL